MLMHLFVSAFVTLGAQASPQPAAAPELYRFVLIQAAPGRLLDLIDLYKKRLPVIAAGGDELPYIVRHSQGDRWDLLVIYRPAASPAITVPSGCAATNPRPRRQA
jgi:hypothetical protein